MNLSEFKNKIRETNEINVIGPLFCQEDLNFVLSNAPTILVDGGNINKKFFKTENIISIGDNDSSELPLDHKLDSNKDYSDLNFCLNILEENVTKISLLGFIGARRDHEYCNIGEVYNFLSNRQNYCEITLNHYMKAHSAGNIKLNHQGTFSILSLHSDAEISISGKVKYPCFKKINKCAFSSETLSNEASGPFNIESNKPFLISIISNS